MDWVVVVVATMLQLMECKNASSLRTALERIPHCSRRTIPLGDAEITESLAWKKIAAGCGDGRIGWLKREGRVFVAIS